MFIAQVYPHWFLLLASPRRRIKESLRPFLLCRSSTFQQQVRGVGYPHRMGVRAGLADASNAIEENPRAPDARTRPGDDEVGAGIFSLNFFLPAQQGQRMPTMMRWFRGIPQRATACVAQEARRTEARFFPVSFWRP